MQGKIIMEKKRLTPSPPTSEGKFKKEYFFVSDIVCAEFRVAQFIAHELIDSLQKLKAKLLI